MKNKNGHAARLVVMPSRLKTEQRKVAGQFTADIDGVEDFVIMARMKDGTMKVYACADREIGIWPFVDVFRLRAAERTLEKLTGSAG